MITQVPPDELAANRNLTLAKREREGREGERERRREGESDSMCNNSPAEWTSPEDGWRSSGRRIPDHSSRSDVPRRWRAWEFLAKCVVQGRVKQLLVQILGRGAV